MRRFDTFLYAGEVDMLECRLATLAGKVDQFIAVESNETFQGAQKFVGIPNYLRSVYPIRHVTARLKPSVDPWPREFAQREWTRKGLEDCGVQSGDLVLHGDVDEIPDPNLIEYLDPQGCYMTCEQSFRCFALDWLHPQTWLGTQAAYYRDLADGFTVLRHARDIPLKGGHVQNVERVTNAGWHLSWFGDTYNKVRSFSHVEFKDTTRDQLEKCRREGIHIDGTQLEPLTDPSMPEWCRENAPRSWWRPVDKAGPL